MFKRQTKLKANQHALAYFYCYYQEETRSDPGSILRAIAKQLCIAYSSEGLPAPLWSIYEKREKEGHSTGPLDLFESRSLIINLSKEFLQTTIIIDALDECNPATRIELLRALKGIAISGNSVKIFVTGRNEGDIRDMLFKIPNHYIDAKDNSEDIRMYIKAEIKRFCTEKPSLKVDTALESEIVFALENGAKGM